MRKLVSIQKVKEVSEIPGADNIVCITVLGWKLVTQRSNNLKIGDKIVYFEIDSFIPEIPFFEFLRPSSFRTHADGTTGFKIRTAKFRGQVSQGFALPLVTLVNELNCKIQLIDGIEVLENSTGNTYSLEEGTDLTETFGVKKFEAPIPTNLAGVVEGEIPGFLKTDEIRIQILQPLLDEFKGVKFFATEKLDGSSTTMYIDDEGIFRVCGRQWQWSDDDKNAMWRYAKEHKIEEKLRSLNFRAAIQGEIVGDGIQSNLYKIKGHRIYFYSLFNIDTHQRASYNELSDVMDALGLLTCPLVLFNFIMTNDMDALVKMADGKSVINPQTEREGLVFRPLFNTMAPGYGLPHDILSFKSISSKFLLKHDD